MSEVGERPQSILGNNPQHQEQVGPEADQAAQKQAQTDKELALRLAAIIEDANSRVIPLTRMIRKVRSLSSVAASPPSEIRG